ncbi:hypothetical protein [Actinoplanes sp. DH11]|uniref:hypothetical protein n=1 Tax=Actinoplanes sp. DH11 TaxID=2857011 RepID=UPI001E533206|nr:hypothetical protein [Actinoplanes sp. DH11]
MSEQTQPRIWSGIDVPKTIAGTLAAVSAAVVGSYLGVAGTLIGAAVASVVSSIGTEIYHRSLDRGSKRLQSAFTTPLAAQAAVGTPEVAAATEPPSSSTPLVRRIRWKRVSLVAGAVFVLALGTLTTAELLAGRSAADVTRGGDSGTATVLNLTRSGPDRSGSGSGADSGSDSDSDKKSPAVEQSAGPGAETPAGDEPSPGAPGTEQPSTAPSRSGQPGTGQPGDGPPGNGQPGTTEPTGEVTGPATEAPTGPGTEPTSGSGSDAEPGSGSDTGSGSGSGSGAGSGSGSGSGAGTDSGTGNTGS